MKYLNILLIAVLAPMVNPVFAQDFTYTYTEDAVKIFADGSFLSGLKAIEHYTKGMDSRIQDYEILKTVPSHIPDRYRYELSRIIRPNGKAFLQLRIWNTEQQPDRCELEMVVPEQPSENNLAEISKRRDLWMQLCNTHKIEELVNNLYAEEALYYNHRPLTVGREEIIPTYGYMKSPQYRLTLTPIVVVPVNPNMVYEIGQCSGSYPGKYVLVWKKGSDAVWRILLDSNI
ncbi:hypothetical protein [Robiginitalea sp. IMCC43444]|uniref:hypothetical protein n=1 Tax=Robiginitalea sp. IMCC43444 TaxID=3459121 RepID=UPI0040431A7D